MMPSKKVLQIAVLFTAAAIVIAAVLFFSPGLGNKALSGDLPSPSENYCKDLGAGTEELIAAASDTASPESAVSSKNEQAPFFLMFEKGETKGVIDTNISVNEYGIPSITAPEVARLLKKGGVEAVVVSNPSEAFSQAMKDRQIACYVAEGEIREVLGLGLEAQ